MFPAGLPGLALLVLRTSVAIALALDGYRHREALSTWTHAIALLLSAALLAGYLTPIVVLLVLLFHGLIWFGFGFDTAAVAVIVTLDATALALLGPGAYSVDARLFGRRRLLVPPPR
jgi:hypothetical protein